MGSVVLNGATSGATTLQPTDATTQTITLPANSGTVVTTASTGAVSQSMLSSNVVGNGPAFSAYQSSSQTVSNGTWTKIQFQTKEFDTASCFDNATNYRFTPNVAGYYQVDAAVFFAATTQWGVCQLYKNGSPFKYGNNVNSSPNGLYLAVSTLVYMNGTTDYLEMYGYQATGGNSTVNATATATFFQGCLVRAA